MKSFKAIAASTRWRSPRAPTIRAAASSSEKLFEDTKIR
jgi:hypothetical protein